jgi:hypothetical protein
METRHPISHLHSDTRTGFEDFLNNLDASDVLFDRMLGFALPLYGAAATCFSSLVSRAERVSFKDSTCRSRAAIRASFSCRRLLSS